MCPHAVWLVCGCDDVIMWSCVRRVALKQPGQLPWQMSTEVPSTTSASCPTPKCPILRHSPANLWAMTSLPSPILVTETSSARFWPTINTSSGQFGNASGKLMVRFWRGPSRTRRKLAVGMSIVNKATRGREMMMSSGPIRSWHFRSVSCWTIVCRMKTRQRTHGPAAAAGC